MILVTYMLIQWKEDKQMRQKQTERILDYMKRFGGITTLDAFRDLGVARLGSRIYDLKREGYDIVSEPM